MLPVHCLTRSISCRSAAYSPYNNVNLSFINFHERLRTSYPHSNVIALYLRHNNTYSATKGAIQNHIFPLFLSSFFNLATLLFPISFFQLFFLKFLISFFFPLFILHIHTSAIFVFFSLLICSFSFHASFLTILQFLSPSSLSVILLTPFLSLIRLSS